MKPVVAAVFLAILALATRPGWADQKLDAAIQKAEGQRRKGNADEGLKTLRKAVAEASADADAHRALARFQARLGNFDEAHAAALKATEVAAPGAARATALAELALLDLRTAPASQARSHAEQAVQADPSALSLAALARAQARLNDAAAVETADRAVKADPRSAAAHVARGWALLAAQRSADAEAAFREAQKLAPEGAEPVAGLAIALAEQGKGADAVAAGQRATTLDDKLGEAWAAYGLALRAQDPKDPKDEAIENALRGTNVETRNGWLKLIAARIYESRNQLDPAGNAYQEAVTLDPSLGAARLGAVQLQYRKGGADAALAEIQKLPPELAKSPEVALLHGGLLLRKERAADAVKVLEQAAQALPRSAEVQAALGAALYGVGDLEKAAASFGRASELDPTNEAYVTNHALFLGYAGKPEQAVGPLLSLTSKPGYRDPTGFINLGYMYRTMKPPKVAESVAAYERALGVDAKNGRAALGIGLAYYGARQWDRAIAAFGRVAGIDSKLAGDAFQRSAWASYHKRDMAQARAFAEKAQAAGVPDSKDLTLAIGRYEAALAKNREHAEAQASQEEQQRESGTSLGALVDTLRNGNGAQQRQAAQLLCKKGAEAVPHLAYEMLSADIGARQVIVSCLRDMGCGAREALGVAQRIVDAGPPVPNASAPRAEMEREMIEGDFFRDVVQLASKLKACR
jgi:Flp pilus assembly protein TadD